MRPLTNPANQTIILVMSKILPLSEVKAKLSEVVDEIATTHERVTVTRNGRPVAVLVSTDDLETIEETIAILSDPAAMRQIEEGRAAIAAGDVATKDEIEALRGRFPASMP
jgi:prevent-host-death family protein